MKKIFVSLCLALSLNLSAGAAEYDAPALDLTVEQFLEKHQRCFLSEPQIDSEKASLNFKKMIDLEDDETLDVFRDMGNLKCLESLKIMQISGIKFNDVAIDLLSGVLSKIPQLSKFSLSGVCMSSEQLAILSNSLSTRSSLEKLNLSDDNLGNVDLSSLANCTSLKYLYLESNNITSGGLKVLIEKVVNNLPNLECLNVNYNKIGNEGAEFLQGYLKNRVFNLEPVFKILFADNNEIDDAVRRKISNFICGTILLL